MWLETERLVIRNLKSEDKDAFVKMVSDGSLHDIFGNYDNYHKLVENWIKESLRLDIENNPYNQYLSYAIIEKKSNKVIGSVGCSYYEDLEQIGIVYFIDALSRSNGYGSEAAIAYSRYFLEHYDVPAMIANIKTENIASCRVAEKSDFKLIETKMYKDIYDTKEYEYNFYELRN